MSDFETFKSRYPGFAAHHEAFATRQWTLLSDAQRAAAIAGIDAFFEGLKVKGRRFAPSPGSYLLNCHLPRVPRGVAVSQHNPDRREPGAPSSDPLPAQSPRPTPALHQSGAEGSA